MPRTSTPTPVSHSIHDTLVHQLRVSPGHDVLELGCGTGDALADILAAMGPSGSLTGVDINGGAIAAATRRFPDAVASGQLWLWDTDISQGLPFPNRSYDRVLSHNLLERIPGTWRLVNEAHRVLRPGGLLVLGHDDIATMTFTATDQALSQRLVHAFCTIRHRQLGAVNPAVSRELLQLIERSEFELRSHDVVVERHEDFAPGGHARMMVEAVAFLAVTYAREDPAVVQAWKDDLAAVHARGEFALTMTTRVATARRNA